MTENNELIAVPLQLELAGVELSATGATVTGPIDPTAVVAGLAGVSRWETSARWVVGDLVLALDEAYGDPALTMRAIAGLGYEQAWLASSVEVCRRIPAGIRSPGLAWGHHAAVARVDGELRGLWLEQAEAKGWSVRVTEAKVAEWLGRDQGELDGVGGDDVAAPYRMPPVVGRRIGEILAMDSDAWVLVHPKTGDARLFRDGGR